MYDMYVYVCMIFLTYIYIYYFLLTSFILFFYVKIYLVFVHHLKKNRFECREKDVSKRWSGGNVLINKQLLTYVVGTLSIIEM